jgi:hypothetical protein
MLMSSFVYCPLFVMFLRIWAFCCRLLSYKYNPYGKESWTMIPGSEKLGKCGQMKPERE